MPIYAYFCDRCNTKFEFWQSFDNRPKTVCPDCETPTLQKVYQVANAHYKGDGWHVADKDKPEKLG